MSYNVSKPISRREFVIDYISPLICEPLSGQSGDVEISILPFDELLFPTGLLVVGDSTYTLTWNAVSRAVCYNVYRATDIVGPYNLIAACINSRTYDDNPGSGTFYYRVSAITDEGETPLSPPVPTPEPVPPPVVVCTIEPTEFSSIGPIAGNGFLSGAIDTFQVPGVQQFCTDGETIYLGTLGGAQGAGQFANSSGNVAGRAEDAGSNNDSAYWSRTALGETTADFTQPAVGFTEDVQVTDDSPAVNQEIRIDGGGYYRVTAKPVAGTLTLLNLYANNTAPGTNIPAASAITFFESIAMGLVGISSAAAGISDSGKAVYYNLFTATEFHSYIYTPGGAAVDMGVPEVGASVQAGGMNNLDDVCGYMTLPSDGGNTHAFFYRAGIFNDIAPAGADFSDGLFIAPGAPYVTGLFTLPAFPGQSFTYLSFNGAPGTTIGLLYAAGSISPAGVNDSGVVVGTADVSAVNIQGFRYNGALISLGSLGFSPFSSNAKGINSAGWVCGNSRNGGGPSNQSAVIWKPDNTIIDLNTLLNATDASHWFLYDAYSINDDNQVAGFGFLDGVNYSFIFQIPAGT